MENIGPYFQEIYPKIREKENRIISDENLRELPNTFISQPFHSEWEIRKRSCNRLIQYIRNKNKTLKILEIGCGNGWLSHQISKNHDVYVWGLDINELEILQAKRVFNRDNLKFIYGSLGHEYINQIQFDLIIFAASIQYFSSLKKILLKSFERLKIHGEVLIMDTPFYQPEKLNLARQRSLNYYSQLLYPEMAQFYFHHTLQDLHDLPHTVLFNPKTILNLFWRRDPFYMISLPKIL